MNAFEYALMFAIPGFLLLMLAEFAYSKLSGRDTWRHQADAISSVNSGLTYLVLRTLEFGLLVIGYELVFRWAEPGPPVITGALLYVAVFVWRDFVGYWIHRWAHANSFLWAMHLIHHSSEEFNLPVALRQNAFNWLSYTGAMLLPLAFLGVPVEVVAVVVPIHFFLQFWYHTQHVGKLGWLEYIIVTPSQHRVHHAINPRYLDPNFGLIFCWDRLFGTFQEELPDDPLAYGITTPVRHYNPVMIELNYMGRLLRDAIFTRRWRDKTRVFFSRTGWRPDDVARRWPLPKIDYRDPSRKFAVHQPAWQIGWAWLHYGLTLLLASYTLANIGQIPAGAKFALLLIVLAGIVANSQQLMRRASLAAEAVRFALLLWLGAQHLVVFGHWVAPALGYSLFILLSVVSVTVSLLCRQPLGWTGEGATNRDNSVYS